MEKRYFYMVLYSNCQGLLCQYLKVSYFLSLMLHTSSPFVDNSPPLFTCAHKRADTLETSLLHQTNSGDLEDRWPSEKKRVAELKNCKTDQTHDREYKFWGYRDWTRKHCLSMQLNVLYCSLFLVIYHTVLLLDIFDWGCLLLIFIQLFFQILNFNYSVAVIFCQYSSFFFFFWNVYYILLPYYHD